MLFHLCWKRWVALIVILMIPLTFFACLPAGGQNRMMVEPMNPDPSGFAVVELFTSEGCSSCPPADALLGEIVESARRGGTHIFPIALHVDYWDQLGWRDPFSNAGYSQRQTAYANAFHAQEIYTPQMIVNGADAFIGSDRGRAAAAVAAALSKPAAVRLSLRASVAADHQIKLDYTLDHPNAGVLQLIAVERGLSSKVERGENGGRTLRHENVARVLQTIPSPEASGSVVLKLPADVKISNASVIGFIQDPRSLAIRGAGIADLVPASTQPSAP
jgi:hypothetical protein